MWVVLSGVLGDQREGKISKCRAACTLPEQARLSSADILGPGVWLFQAFILDLQQWLCREPPGLHPRTTAATGLCSEDSSLLEESYHFLCLSSLKVASVGIFGEPG